MDRLNIGRPYFFTILFALAFIPWQAWGATIGPYIQHPTSTGFVISWITEGSAPTDSVQLHHPSGKITTHTPQPRPFTYLKDYFLHEAQFTGLQNGQYHYRVDSDEKRKFYRIQTAPTENQSVRLLLLSDHQGHQLVRTTSQTVGKFISEAKPDLLLFAGDCVNYPNDQTEWFDKPDNSSFFETFTSDNIILQETFLLPTPGNHDVSGYAATASARLAFNAATPRDWNSTTYEEIFNVPTMNANTNLLRLHATSTTNINSGSEVWYSLRYGNCFIVSLFAAAFWVPGNAITRTGPTYTPNNSHGRFIFEPIGKHSIQYNWLITQLESNAAKTAKTRIVFFHHPVFSQGHSMQTLFGNPFDYSEDFLVRDLVPLFEKYNVQLVFYGHDHIVGHFVYHNIHFFQCSNFGNTYGSYSDPTGHNPGKEPHGLLPELYISSNETGYFSLLNTADNSVSTYQALNAATWKKIYNFTLSD